MTELRPARPYEWLVTLCSHCEAPAVIIEPGSQEIRDLFLLRRGVPVRCWCRDCWQERFGTLGVRSASMAVPASRP